jgi:hypothetical protein
MPSNGRPLEEEEEEEEYWCFTINWWNLFYHRTFLAG